MKRTREDLEPFSNDNKENKRLCPSIDQRRVRVIHNLCRQCCSCVIWRVSRIWIKMLHLKRPQTLFYSIPHELINKILDYAFPYKVHTWIHLYWYGVNSKPPYDKDIVKQELCEDHLVNLLCYLDIQMLRQDIDYCILLYSKHQGGDDRCLQFVDFYEGLTKDMDIKTEKQFFLDRTEEIVAKYDSCISVVDYVKPIMRKPGEHDLAGNQTLMLEVGERERERERERKPDN